MSLSPEQRREYRAIAHNLKPVIIVGDKGLSEGLPGRTGARPERPRADQDQGCQPGPRNPPGSHCRPVRNLRCRAGPDHRQNRRHPAPGEEAQPQAVQPAAPETLTLSAREQKQKSRLGETRAGFLLPEDRIRRIRPARSHTPRSPKAREWRPRRLRFCPPAPGRWARKSTACRP